MLGNQEPSSWFFKLEPMDRCLIKEFFKVCVASQRCSDKLTDTFWIILKSHILGTATQFLCGHLHLFLKILFLLEESRMTSGSDALIRISQEEMRWENWAIRGPKGYMHITLTTMCSWAGNPKLHRHPLQNPSLNKPNCHRSFTISMARHKKRDLLLAVRIT